MLTIKTSKRRQVLETYLEACKHLWWSFYDQNDWRLLLMVKPLTIFTKKTLSKKFDTVLNGVK